MTNLTLSIQFQTIQNQARLEATIQELPIWTMPLSGIKPSDITSEIYPSLQAQFAGITLQPLLEYARPETEKLSLRQNTQNER